MNSDLYKPIKNDFSYEKLQLYIEKAQTHLDNDEPDGALTLLDNADKIMKHFTDNYTSVTKEQQIVIDKLETMRNQADDLIDARFPDLVLNR